MNHHRIPTIRMDGSVSDYDYFEDATTTILSNDHDDSTEHHWPVLFLEENSSLLCHHCHTIEDEEESIFRLFLRMIFVEYYRTPMLFVSLAILCGGFVGFGLARWMNHNAQQPKEAVSSISLKDNDDFKTMICESDTTKKTSQDPTTIVGSATTTTPTTSFDTITKSTKQYPRHVAIVMDGNRRFGRLHDCNGHAAGAKQLGNVLEWTLELQHVKELTLFCFSTQNWERDESEVNYLFQTLLKEYIEKELRNKVVERCVQVKVHSTDANRIPANVQAQLQSLVESTAQFGTKGHPEMSLCLNLCISYGGREEILMACQKVMNERKQSDRNISITEEDFERHLLVTNPPDLLIRTAGDVRLSNFLLWQTSYTELLFVKETWPAISKERYRNMLLDEYTKRQRRFGR